MSIWRSCRKCAVGILMLSCILLGACAGQGGEEKKIRDLDFTVVQDSELPEPLMKLINEKKANPFKLTYSNSEYLYIVQGYGAQPTGGYSIAVKELWLSENAIYFLSELMGPGENDEVAQTITYPYVVIKTELIDQSVVFQ